MKKIILIFFLGVLFEGHSQVKQVLRKEIERNEIGYSTTLNLEKNGVLTYGFTRENKRQVLNLVLLGSNFEEKLVKSVEIEKDFRFVSFSHSSDKKRISFLFTNSSKFYFLHFDTELFSESKVSGVLPSTYSIGDRNESINLNNHLILFSVTKKKKSAVSIEVNSGKANILTFFDQIKKFDIISLQKIENRELGFFVINEYISKKVGVQMIYVLNEDGDLQAEALKFGETFDKYIVDINIKYISETKFIMSGSYMSFVNNKPSKTTGIFVVEFDDFEQNFIKFFSITDFKKFTGYIESTKTNDETDKKNNKKQQEEVDFGVYGKLHPVIFANGTYTIIGEFYNPTSRAVSSSSGISYVFDGYQYSHVIILNLDKYGEKQFDDFFLMNLNDKPNFITKNVHVRIDKNFITLFYCNGNQFKSSIIEGNGVSETDYGSIELNKVSIDKSDKIISSIFSNSLYWYGNYFLSYGSQYLKNSEEKIGDKKRSIFVLTKIEF